MVGYIFAKKSKKRDLKSLIKSKAYHLFFLAICFLNSYGFFFNIEAKSNFSIFSNDIELVIDNMLDEVYSAFDFQIEESLDWAGYTNVTKKIFFEISEIKQVKNVLEISLDSNSPPPWLV